MASRQLNSRILVLDRQLILEQWQLRSNGRRCLEQLRGVSPLGLLSTGLVAGLLAGWLVSARAIIPMPFSSTGCVCGACQTGCYLVRLGELAEYPE